MRHADHGDRERACRDLYRAVEPSAIRTDSEAALGRLASPVRLDGHRRVDEDVAAPIPHRPGLAEFPHPVLHERDSLAAAYPWAIWAGGSGWRFRSSLRRAQRTTLWRSRRDSHFCHIRTT